MPEEIKEISDFVKTKMGPVPISLLPYNKMSESKYERLDRPFIRLDGQDEEYINGLESIVALTIESPDREAP